MCTSYTILFGIYLTYTQYKLKQNQAYANLPIDVLRTTKGKPVGQTTSVDKLVIEVVVSADVIEYIND